MRSLLLLGIASLASSPSEIKTDFRGLRCVAAHPYPARSPPLNWEGQSIEPEAYTVRAWVQAEDLSPYQVSRGLSCAVSTDYPQ